MAESRVPSSPASAKEGWSLETAIDYLLAVLNEKDEHIRTLITANDKRYAERFDASQQALTVGFAAAKAAVDASFAAQKEAINAALAAADRAVTKAELATEKRFESVNEFRGTLDNQQRTLIPRSEVAEIVKGLEEKIANVTKVVDKVEQDVRDRTSERKGVQGGWGYAVGAVGFVLLVAAFAMRFVG